ncbi:MAG: anaerobic ribonucleoside-triphosphate reductase [Methermicoccaceae archaeon]
MELKEFIEKTQKEAEEKGISYEGIEPDQCPVNKFSIEGGRCYGNIGTVAYCPVCGNPYCPGCGNHHVLQLSRITGYIQDVSGWNAAKKQELKDRKRYSIQ